MPSSRCSAEPDGPWGPRSSRPGQCAPRSSRRWIETVPCGSGRLGERRDLSAAHPELSVLDPVLVLEQCSRRRARRARPIFVVDAAVARAHEELRLREPANGTSEVGAIDREDLKAVTIHTPHPAGDVRRRTIPGHAEGILIRGEPGLPRGKALERAELDPRLL